MIGSTVLQNAPEVATSLNTLLYKMKWIKNNKHISDRFSRS